jgi:hypothetical protein
MLEWLGVLRSTSFIVNKRISVDCKKVLTELLSLRLIALIEIIYGDGNYKILLKY